MGFSQAFQISVWHCNAIIGFHHHKNVNQRTGQSTGKPKWESHCKCMYISNVCRGKQLQLPLDINSCASLLQVCMDSKSVRQGKQLHAHMFKTDLIGNFLLINKLVVVYAVSGNTEDARQLFDKLYIANVFLWNTMIRGYTNNAADAIALYCKMQNSGVEPNNFTFPFVLKACARAGMPARQIHAHIIKTKLEMDAFVGTALLDMYAKCGVIGDARKVFDKMLRRNVVSWNAIIVGYANLHGIEAFGLFGKMLQLAGVKPDSVTMVSVLLACASSGIVYYGKCVHSYIIRSGIKRDVSVENALIAMYAKCKCVHDARQVFDRMPDKDVVSWNTMIAHGNAEEALALFHQMQSSNVMPDWVTMLSILPACARLGDLQQGKGIHDRIIDGGYDSNVSVSNSLVAMYAKCGSVDNAFQVFDKISNKNVVSWNAMIMGYTENGLASEALECFRNMIFSDIKPDSATIVCVLPACAHLAALQQGKWIHGYSIRSGFESDDFVQNALVTMYARCGIIDDARFLFDKMSRKDVVSWNAMIGGYGIQGHFEEAIALFSQMQQTDSNPDDITLTGILSACSHAGLVDEGWQYFNSIIREYSITPNEKHYACMVDLLGRAGHLDEACDLIKRMPLELGPSVWGSLLGACRMHHNVELGEYAAEHLIELEPDDAGHYVMLSNIYAAAGRWDDVMRVRTKINSRGLKKDAGRSWIEIKNRIHTFVAADRSHPQSEEIYATLESLTVKIKERGYVPDTSFVLHNLPDEDKEYILCTHSEKLAIVFGLIHASPVVPIKITKNLRMCGDCHSAIKFISNTVLREFIVRDAKRFHRFKDGLCSCGDYW